MTDPVELALRAALEHNDGAELRVALGKLLLERGRAAEALSELELGLRATPTDRTLLELAARAATEAGDTSRATAYRLALGTPPTRPPRAAPASTSHLRVVGEEEGLETVSVRFDDISGLEPVKDRLRRSFLLPLQNPELHARFGKKVGGGLVLYGPPGCGKTYIAKALAGEIGARFLNISISNVLNSYYGGSELRLAGLFDVARRRAPTVVFFDELDAIGQKRSSLGGSTGRTLVNLLLAELDGVDSKNDGVFFMGATNHPWDLDSALRRPGRLDQLVFVPPPDQKARVRILKTRLEGRPVAPDTDLSEVARECKGMTGADMAALADDATELAFERSVQMGAETPIDEETLWRARDRRRCSADPWFAQARNHALYGKDSGFDDLLSYLKKTGRA